MNSVTESRSTVHVRDLSSRIKFAVNVRFPYGKDDVINFLDLALCKRTLDGFAELLSCGWVLIGSRKPHPA